MYKICICVDGSLNPPQATLHSVKTVGEFCNAVRGYTVLVTEVVGELFYLDWIAGDEFPTIHETFQGTPGEMVVRYLPASGKFLWGVAAKFQEKGEEAFFYSTNHIYPTSLSKFIDHGKK